MEVDIEKEKSSYRSELSKFVEDNAQALIEKENAGEKVDELWHLESLTGKVVCIAHLLGVIPDEEAEKYCSLLASSCPLLQGKFMQEWQKNFGLLM